MTFAKKRFGQNFLHDQHVIARITQAIHCEPHDHLIEIGPGKAALTQKLLSVAQLDVIEIDRDLIPGLIELTIKHKNLYIHNEDALNFDYSSLAKHPHSLRIVGNLPYNISTPLIFHLLSFKNLIKDMHFMLQKEVVDRISAEPGSKTYGRLSVMTQYHCKVVKLFEVPPSAFTPQPKVDSAILRLTPKEPELAVQDIDQLQLIVTHAFSQRRKTLRNSLKEFISSEALQMLQIDPQYRPEQLSVTEYVTIANYYSANHA